MKSCGPDRSFGFLALSMGIISFATLMFETVLLKQLSFLIGSWSYIASIVLCSFMLGSGIGVLLARNNRLNISYSFIPILQGLAVIITSFSLLKFDIIFKISTNLIFIGLMLSPTFIFFGYLFITILNRIRNEAPDYIRFIYSADLVGAALGGILTVFVVLPFIGINKTVILCAILFFISSLFLSPKGTIRNYKMIYFCIAGLSLMLFFNIGPLIERHRNIKNTPLYKILKDSGELLYTGWSPLQRIDLIKEKDGFTITYDGFPWTSFVLPPNPLTTESLINSLERRFMKALYPFVHNPRDILIIGVGAGPDIFYSKTWLDSNMAVNRESLGSITGIEIDPLVVDLLKNKFKDLNENIFNDPHVNIIVDDGRHFIETTSKKYDLIHYPGVDTPFAFTSAYGANPYLRAENYLYTFEGLMSAYERLSEDGAIFISVGNWFPESFAELDIPLKMRSSIAREGRLIATFKLILEKKGIKRWEDYVEVACYGFSHSKDNSMVESMIKVTKKPIDPGQIRLMLNKYNIQRPVYFLDKASIIELSKQQTPTTDDQPFYYNFPLTTIPAIIQENLLFTLMLLIPFIIYSLACLKLTNKCRNLGITWLLFMFFVCIGISFMMVQLLYTQQAIILLKNSFLGTVVLFSLLLVLSGIGSIYTNGLSNWKNKLFFILILIPLYNLLLPHMIASARPAVANSSIYFKTIILSAFIFPLGLLLGVFFPLGFLLSNQLEPKISFSWLYSMDILGSIVGILVGISLPIKIGYRNSIYCLSCLLLIQVILVFWLRWLSLIDKRAEERI